VQRDRSPAAQEALLLEDLEALRTTHPQPSAEAVERVRRWARQYVKSSFGGGLTTDDLEDVVSSALTDFLEQFRDHDEQRATEAATQQSDKSDNKSVFVRALERHRKRAKRHAVRTIRHSAPRVYFAKPEQRIRLQQALDEIFRRVPRALEMLNDRYHDLTIDAFGLPRVRRRPPSPPSPDQAHIKARHRALAQFSANLERLLRDEQKQREHPVLEDAIAIVRGQYVEDVAAYLSEVTDG